MKNMAESLPNKVIEVKEALIRSLSAEMGLACGGHNYPGNLSWVEQSGNYFCGYPTSIGRYFNQLS